MWDDDGGYEMMNGDGWSAAIVVLLVVLVLVVIAVGAYVLMHLSRQSAQERQGVSGPSTAPSAAPSVPLGGGQDPRRVLDLRLARGEVTPEEYDAVRAILDRG